MSSRRRRLWLKESLESVDSGLAALRSPREAQGRQSSYARTFSADTISSGLQAMSLDTGSSFSDDANPNIEHRPLLFKSIPWAAQGENVWTIKLALWFLHMETRRDLSVQRDYPPLRSASHQIDIPPGIKSQTPCSNLVLLDLRAIQRIRARVLARRRCDTVHPGGSGCSPNQSNTL